jgi:hypothetical protein
VTERREDCIECGNWLPDTSAQGRRVRADRLYCSANCRVNARRRANYVPPAEKVCRLCGDTFRPLRGKQTYCDIDQASKECRELQEQHKENQAQQALDAEDARWEAVCAREGCEDSTGWTGSGRPRRFCSDRCKTANYRTVKRSATT